MGFWRGEDGHPCYRSTAATRAGHDLTTRCACAFPPAHPAHRLCIPYARATPLRSFSPHCLTRLCIPAHALRMPCAPLLLCLQSEELVVLNLPLSGYRAPACSACGHLPARLHLRGVP